MCEDRLAGSMCHVNRGASDVDRHGNDLSMALYGSREKLDAVSTNGQRVGRESRSIGRRRRLERLQLSGDRGRDVDGNSVLRKDIACGRIDFRTANLSLLHTLAK